MNIRGHSAVSYNGWNLVGYTNAMGIRWGIRSGLVNPTERNSESKSTIVNAIATMPRDRRTIKVHSLLIEEEMRPGTGMVLAGKVICCSLPNLY